MVLLIARLLARVFSIDITRAQQWAVIALILIGVIAITGVVWGVVSWITPDEKIDQVSINKINASNEKERKEELRQVVEENADVVRSVDNRTTIAEVNVVERDRKIDEKVAEIDRKIMEVKTQEHRDITSAELECLLVGPCK